MKIRTQLTFLGVGSILTTVAVLTGLGIWQSAVFHAGARREVDRLVDAELRRTTRSAYDLVRSQDQSLTSQVAHAERTAFYLVGQQGGFSTGPDQVRWTAVNQITHVSRTLTLPQMRVGKRWLGQNTDPKRQSPVVDGVRSLSGAEATIFQRLDAQGDLLRVATTIQTRMSRRAVGTFIPAVKPDGSVNPVTAQVLHGKTYCGNAFVVSAWYVSEYAPLFDTRHRVIGALYTGLKQEQVAALRQAITQAHVGTTGTLRVLCGTGPQKGWYRIAPPGTPTNTNVFQARDAQGHLYIQAIIRRALALPPGESAQIRYLAPPDSSGARPAWHVAQVTYYKPWDWVIIADTRADDFKGVEERLSAGRARMAWTFLVFGCVLAGASGWFLWRVACRIARAAGEVADGADHLANQTMRDFSRAFGALGAGALDEAHIFVPAVLLPVRTQDEIGRMAASFNAVQLRVAEASAGLDEARQRLGQARRETETLLAEAVEQADRDPLTGLLNHRAFQKRLQEEADRAQREGMPFTVAILDLNNFKFFNDAYGHLAGDDVLRQVAAALSAECRSYDTLARFGGDEFALLVPGLSLEESGRLGPRLRGALENLGFRPPGYDTVIPIGLCVGTAVFPDETAVRHEAVALADARLRHTKTYGDETENLAERLQDHLASSYEGFSMLSALVLAVDNKDRYTRRHSEDVLIYSLQIAQELGLDPDSQFTVQVAALLHDVGKIGVPDAILRKPGSLSKEEHQAIQQHPIMGAIIVGAVPGFEKMLDSVRHHHERWDGGGYPFKLQGLEIPILARLMAVADAYSAMTTDRPYRKGMNPEKALGILRDGAGTQWDPECVSAFQRARHPASQADPYGAAPEAYAVSGHVSRST